MLRLFLVFLAATASNSLPDTAQATLESRTADLMAQVLTAVSSKSDDEQMLGRLCTLINDIDLSLIQMTSQEVSDYEYAMAHMRADLTIAKTNLTALRGAYNRTVGELARHLGEMGPLPRHYESSKARESALIRQKQQMMQECEKDVQGHRFRTDAVKADISILDSALEHLSKLSQGSSGDGGEVSLLQLSEPDVTCGDKDITGPVVRCQNGYYLPISESNGTITTFPPGNGMIYTQKLKCGFKISPANAGLLDRVELNFLHVDTTGDDVIEIFDGPEANRDKLLASFRGKLSNLPRLTSKMPEVTVMFSVSPTSRHSSSGLIATFKQIRIPLNQHNAINMCAASNGQAIVLTGESGFVAEDARPEFADALLARAGTAYGHSLKCTWNIMAKLNESINLHWTFMKTEEGTDFLSIYDGESKSAPLLLKSSGNQLPIDVQSSGSSLTITYTADYTVDGFGFHLSWCVNSSIDCPGGRTKPELPHPSDTIPPAATFNSSAPAPLSIPPPSTAVNVAPPEYPLPVAVPQEGTCCPSDCSFHGICNPSTCMCACNPGFTTRDCSIATDSFNSDGMTFDDDTGNYLQTEEGVTVDVGTLEKIQDQCGDDVESISPQTVSNLNLDPVTELLEKLKFQLFRSLNYEHDTTNATRRDCAHDLQQFDRDLEALQQEVLLLGKAMGDSDAKTKMLTEERDQQLRSLTTSHNLVADLTAKIEGSKALHDSKYGSQQTQRKTLQSMRELISQLSGTTCSLERSSVSFAETPGAVCYGELLDLEHSTSDVQECKSLCVGSCVAFTFLSSQGCRFFSSLQSQKTGCGEENSTCSCFQKL